MKIEIHPHAQQRLLERGATSDEVIQAVVDGEEFPAKFDRTGFRKNFSFETTMNDHGWVLPPEGDQRAASNKLSNFSCSTVRSA